MIPLPQLRNQRIHPFRNVRRTLAPLAAIAPNVPVLPQAPGKAVFADGGRREAFVVPVVPFADRGGDLDVCGCLVRGEGGGGRGVGPRVAVFAA